MKGRYLLRGHIIHTPKRGSFDVIENGYIVCENGRVAEVAASLPAGCEALPVIDHSDRLIIPGLCDTHLHAPQYAFRALGMDMELIEWLNRRAFPEEIKYNNPEYAALAYGQFADDLRASATTRACVFATTDAEGSITLARLLEASGLRGYVGKVSMDRNAPEALLDPEGQSGADAAESWLASASGFSRVKPILTPRFVPACTDGLLDGLAALKHKYALPLQSHLSENPDEVAWVRRLHPDADCYLEVYSRFGLLDSRTVMAHCVYPENGELELLKASRALVSHCPASNMNLASGIAPIRRYLDAGVRVSLGTDIAGGCELSMLRAITDAIQVSKLKARQTDMREKPLALSEAFYLATKGGGEFFGDVGSFEKGNELDAVVLDDGALRSPAPLGVLERLERALYLEKNVKIKAKYVGGEELFSDVEPHKEDGRI